MRAVQISNHGGPEVLESIETETPTPQGSEILVRTEFAGINYIDIYQRGGMYPMSLPVTLGLEGGGQVVEVGDLVKSFKVGDRISWGWAPGSYAEFVLVSEEKAVRIPDGISTAVAAASMMQCITAHYLVTSVYKAQPGDTALVHAAAGGVGLILCQMLVAKGVTVIGTVSSAEKELLAKAAGATHVIRYDQEEFASAVSRVTGGKKCNVVYDGVGADTFEGSLQCIEPRGTLALFGAASGPVPPFDLQRLSSLGSLNITRPTIAHFIQTREELVWRTGNIFDAIKAGELKIAIAGFYALEDTAQAHTDIQSRRTSGKLLIRV
jgi:NADPH2:quinone reductase